MLFISTSVFVIIIITSFFATSSYEKLYTLYVFYQILDLCFVGISNKPWKIAEHDLLRRTLSRRLYTPLPNSDERSALFKKDFNSFEHTLQEEDFRYIFILVFVFGLVLL